MISVMISSFLASFGFAILFNIKGNKLWLAGLGGSIGSIVHSICLSNGLDEVIALFLASIAFSVFSEVCARIQHTPVTTFIICALIPLVPGGGMYQMMVKAISSDVMGALQIGLDTISNAGALALGIIFVSTITRVMTSAKKQRLMNREKSKIDDRGDDVETS